MIRRVNALHRFNEENQEVQAKLSSVWWLQKIRSRYDWCWKKCEAGQHPQVRSGQGASLGSWRTGDESKRSVWGVWGELISRPVANMPFFSLGIFNMSWIKGTKLLINSWVSIQKLKYSKEQSFAWNICPQVDTEANLTTQDKIFLANVKEVLIFYLIFEYFFSHFSYFRSASRQRLLQSSGNTSTTPLSSQRQTWLWFRFQIAKSVKYWTTYINIIG